MDIADNFDTELRASMDRSSYRATFLPEVITTIAARLLPVDGTSLSLLSDELRMPLAASDEQARKAETVQFTLGDGPCLETYRTGLTQSFTESELAGRWPLYLDAIVERTSYRSVASVPLDLGSRLVGALDLYLVSPDGLPAPVLDDAQRLVAIATDSLDSSPHAHDGVGPVWLDNPAAQQRTMAWIAIGLIARAADLTAANALDLIRAYAWQHGQTVDEISEALASHMLSAEELVGDR